MKKVLLLMVVPALLVALGFAQTPAASINTDQTNIKGCAGGSDGNYTLVEDNTGHIFKIASSSVDLKAHLGHDVTLIGHRASGVSSAAADNSFAVTELNMISEQCAAAAAAPTAPVSTPSETASTLPAAAAAPAATVTTPAETAVTPAATTAAPAATATSPAETVTPATTAAAPAATRPSETAVTLAAAPVHPTPLPARPSRSSEPVNTPAAAAATPTVTASTSSEAVNKPVAADTTPAVTASASSEPVNTPAAAASTPTVKGGSLWLLISFAVVVIVIGTLAPLLNRWRKRKILERTGPQNLSFTPEARSDQGKSDPPVIRKAA